jgi:hypothetical protein
MTRLLHGRSLLSALTISLSLSQTLYVTAAHAQAKDPSKDERNEAQERYRRALELFNDGSYDAALLELRRAYELAPSYRILYNIALVNVQLNDYASALGFFERYLTEGGTEIPTARVEEVRKEISRLQTRVASVTIVADVTGAEVSVDDLPVGKTPLDKPVRVNAGRRRVSVAFEGKAPQNRVVEMAGGDKIELKFKLSEPERAVAPTPIAPPVAPPPRKPPPERKVPWIAWGVTGVLGAAAATTGVLALLAHGEQNDAKAEQNVDPNKLDYVDNKVSNFALATDILLGATIVAGGVSLYLTLSAPHGDSSGETAIIIQPNGVSGRVTF